MIMKVSINYLLSIVNLFSNSLRTSGKEVEKAQKWRREGKETEEKEEGKKEKGNIIIILNSKTALLCSSIIFQKEDESRRVREGRDQGLF